METESLAWTSVALCSTWLQISPNGYAAEFYCDVPVSSSCRGIIM